MDQVNTKATFAQDDLFERKRYMDVCMKLIENHPQDRGACTIAVDAPWGVGKSTFLWMWINELMKAQNDKSTDGHTLAFYYNAWESDFSDSALAPLLYAICAHADKERNNDWLLPEDDSFLTDLVSSSIGLLLTFAVYHFSQDALIAQTAGTTGQMTTKGLIGLFSRYLHKDIEEPEPGSIGETLDKQLEAQEKFRDALSNLASKFGRVIIFIDELDRCKPTFAIETLEAIKHYFDVPGLSFVFGVDMTQLGHAIGGRYGNSMDTGGYLSKFFDHQVRLSKPTASQMINAEQHNIPKYNDNFLKPLSEVFSACRITPREISGIIKHANTIWQYQFRHLVTNNSYAPYITIVALLGMKTLRKEMYDSFLHGNIVAFKSEWEPDYPSVYYHLESVSRMCNMPDWQVVKETSDILNRSSASSLNEHTASLYRMCYHLADDEESSLMLFRDKLSNLLELTI